MCAAVSFEGSLLVIGGIGFLWISGKSDRDLCFFSISNKFPLLRVFAGVDATYTIQIATDVLGIVTVAAPRTRIGTFQDNQANTDQLPNLEG
jgi:hypothetical protein